jgi:hypothetical protein
MLKRAKKNSYDVVIIAKFASYRIGGASGLGWAMLQGAKKDS